MAAKQTIKTTTTVTKTKTKRTKSKGNSSGNRRKCPSCGKFY